MSSLSLSFFTPKREQCGISDYSRHLLQALRDRTDVGDVHVVKAPADAVRASSGEAVRHFREDNRRFRSLGAQMNGADLAHVQHQYFFFGGVAPHKNHATAFHSAIRVPLVVTVHEIATPEAQNSPVIRAALRLSVRQNFLHPAIQHFIVHTTQDSKRLLECGLPEERITVIPVGVPSALPIPDPQEAKRSLGLEGKRIVLLFGFLSTKKGHRVALDALTHLPEDVTLLFAGERHPDDHTDYMPQLLAEIQARGLTQRLKISGYLPDAQIPTVMAAADVAIAPFVQSSGSASLAHLLAYGLPVVASDILPHIELARETPTCLLTFPTGDGKALAEQVESILTNTVLRDTLRSAALQYAERHSYAHMAARTREVYQKVVQGA